MANGKYLCCSVIDYALVKCQFVVDIAPFVVINLTILWVGGAFHDHFVWHCLEGSFPVLKKVFAGRPLNVLLLD